MKFVPDFEMTYHTYKSIEGVRRVACNICTRVQNGLGLTGDESNDPVSHKFDGRVLLYII